MKWIKRFRLVFLFLSFVVSMSYAANTRFSKKHFSQYPIPVGLQRILRSVHKINITHANVGIIVQSMKTNKILYKKNPDHLYTPASVLKLFIAAAALYYLKPTYQFKTSILTTGKVANHTLSGNIYVKFSGDPELKRKDLTTLLHKLKHLGIKSIKGRVYIDNSDYNRVPYPPGWIWDDLSYSYAAPLNAIIINRNKFLLRFIPAKKMGRRPQLQSKLPPKVARFTNNMVTTKTYRKACPITIYSSANNHYTVGGCLDKRWGRQARKLAVRNVETYAKALIKMNLREAQIQFKGAIQIRKAPKKVHVLARHISPPLSKIVREMLKKSDNLTTNTLLKKMGEVYYHTRGTWQNGLYALKKILAKPTGIDFKHNLIADGAGLSRYNLVTPRQLLKLLRFAYRHSLIKKAFLAALPIAGRDGTLEDRMISEGKSGRIHAKTGSMTGVTSLAGYVITKHNGMLSFVIMINGFVGKRSPYILLENRICEFLVRAKRSR